MRVERSTARHIGLGILAVSIIVTLKLLLGQVLNDQGPFLLMPLAVLLTAWYGGRSAGLFATLLSTLAIGYFFLSPSLTLNIGVSGSVQLGFFILEGVLLSLFGASRRDAIAELERREKLLSVTLASIGDAVIATDTAGTITFLNPVAERLTGWSKEEAGTRHLDEVFRIVNEESGVAADNPVEQVLREGKAVGLANHTILVARDGHRVLIEDSAAPIRDESGTILGVILVFHDVSDRRRVERERDFRLRASERLGSSLDYQKTLAEVADLAVPDVADWAAVDMLDDEGKLVRVAVTHVNPEKVKWALELQRKYPPDLNAPTGVPYVLRTGETQFYPKITAEMLRAVPMTDEQRRIVDEIGFNSVMIVPLRAGDAVVGAISFVVTSESGREYDERNLAVAQDLARHASTAIENAILHRQIAEQREWLRVTIASIGDAVIATDTEGTVTFMNTVAEGLTGWKIGEAMGLPVEHVFDIVNEFTGETASNPIARVLREGKIVGLANHTVLISRDGVRRPIEDSAAPIADERHGLRGVVMVFHDVTEQRIIENVLRESEHRFRTLADSAPVLIWMSDTSALCTYFNRGWLEFTGRTMEQELGNGWAESVHLDDLQRCLDIYLAAFEARAAFKMEYRLRRHDGEYRWVLDNGIPRFDADENFIGYIGSCIDITDRKQSEHDLEQAKEEAEAASRAKDQFLAVLSHELRTPLTPVLAMVQSMEGDRRVPRDLQGFFEIIRRNVELEARLIDDLLDLTRITKGKLQLNLETVNAHALMRNVLEICRNDIYEKKITVVTELQASRHMVRADSARLQQVYWNLVKNAVKFTPQEGRIKVLSSNTADGALRMEVIDTGIGIEPEIMPRIFDAFEQGEQTITRHFGGLGLGLAISKALVDAHHGVLEAASEGKGKGARFSITLPVDEAGPEPADSGTTSAPELLADAAPVRILIVDDHADTVTVTKMLLERSGYQVLTAQSMQEALEIGSREEFSLLISDIGLPDGSGIDLMRELAGRRNIRGIAISGFGMEEDVVRSREAGFVEHLTKPINFQKLREAIARIVPSCSSAEHLIDARTMK